MNAKFFRNGIVMLVLVVGTVALLYTWLIQRPRRHPSATPQFLSDVQQNKVATVIQEGTTLDGQGDATAAHLHGHRPERS